MGNSQNKVENEDQLQLLGGSTTSADEGTKGTSKHHSIGGILILITFTIILLCESFDDNKVVTTFMKDARNVYETTEIIDKIKSFINLNSERMPALPAGGRNEVPVEKPRDSWFGTTEEQNDRNRFKQILS